MSFGIQAGRERRTGRKILRAAVWLAVYAAAMFGLMQYEANRLCDQLRDVQKTGVFTTRVPLKLSEFFLIRIAGERVSPRFEYALNLLGSMKSVRGRLLMEDCLNSHLWRERYIAVCSLTYYQDERMFQTFLQQLKREEHPQVIQQIFVSLMKSRNRMSASYLDEAGASVRSDEALYYVRRIKELGAPDSQSLRQEPSGLDEAGMERIRRFESVWGEEKGLSGNAPASGAFQLETGKIP